jgi:hypothetical protein
MKAVSCGTLIDGDSDRPREDVVILVDGGRVVDVVEDDSDVPAGADRADHTSE